MAQDVVIQTRNLTKIYRDFWGRKKVRALNSLSMEVVKGEVFGLLGPNGSGKTTTLKLLLGLLFPTEGDVTILGKPATDVTKNERIGYLPEESYLYRFLNAEETLDFYGKLFNMSASVRRERAKKLIERVGLTHARRRQLKEYSKGMTRRIGLAQALINEPDLILLDEPTSGLDPLGSRDMKDMIVKLKEEGKTVVMCSHLLADVQDVCDRIAILDGGELKVFGKVQDLLKDQGVTQMKTSRLPEGALKEVEEVLARHGAKMLEVDHPTTNLEDLFIKTVRDSAARPGAAVASLRRRRTRAYPGPAGRGWHVSVYDSCSNGTFMRLSFDPEIFDLLGGFKTWLAVMVVLSIVVFVTSLAMSLVALGFAGPSQVLVHIFGGIGDLFGTSPRRCWAVTQLTFREAVRRKTLLVFAVFAVLFLFAGWFLSDVTADPDLQVKNYVSFVLRTISWLILPVALLLSCWGLPEDIKARSLHTVVTKPVRRHEIVIGRILGYTAIGALILGGMSLVGWAWIKRQLPDSMKSQLTARVPVYGALTFISTEGKDVEAGVNTGDENMFRSFIEGNTKARAIWQFSNIDPAQFSGDRGLVLESSFDAFRTYKGKIDKQLLCQYTLVNEAKKLRALNAFEINEFRRNSYDVQKQNPTLQDVDGKPVELRDLMTEGTLQVEAACLSSAQFLGMARPDLFIRLPDRPFEASYFKCILNIGLMMLMVVVLGVVSGVS